MPSGIYKHHSNQGYQKGHGFTVAVLEKISRTKTGQHHTEATKQKIRETNIRIGIIPPSNYGIFKDNPEILATPQSSKYITIHAWVVREKGKPNKCSHRGTENAKRFEWANIDHKYKRILDDYIRLCTRCHRKYDKNLI